MCAADLAEHRDQHVEDAERGDGVPEQRNAVVGGQLDGLEPAPHDGGYKQRRSHSLGNQLPSERKDGLLLLVRGQADTDAILPGHAAHRIARHPLDLGLRHPGVLGVVWEE